MTNMIDLMRQIRAAMMDYAADVSDEKAVKYPSLFEPWKVNVSYKVDDRRQYNNKLYKCRQAHTSEEVYTPDIIPALWAVIEAVRSGEIDEPIIASRGMEYTYGLYYSDPEDGKLYLCERTGETIGNTIVLQFMPHELIGQYFTEVTK